MQQEVIVQAQKAREREVARKKDRYSGRNEMNFRMEHKREATGCYFIYTYLRIIYVRGYVYVNTFRD